jgi:hypothetical protein
MNIEEMYPQRVRRQFTSIAKEMHEEITRAKEPQLRAMLKTSAQVLNDLARTFDSYEMRDKLAGN